MNALWFLFVVWCASCHDRQSIHPLLEFITYLSNGLLCRFNLHLEGNAHTLPFLAGNAILVLPGGSQSLAVGVEVCVSLTQSVNQILNVLFEFTITADLLCFIGGFHPSTFDGLVGGFMQITRHLDERKSTNPPLTWIPVIPFVSIAIVCLEGVVEVVVSLSVGNQRKEG